MATKRMLPLLMGLGALHLSATAAASPPGAGEGSVRRFALVAGANDGGADRTTLRYAGTDASGMAAVLTRYGGVSPMDTWKLLDPDRKELQDAFSSLAWQIRQAQQDHRRTEVVVYYSGHSDAEGLLLAGEHYTYKELRAALQSLPADVKVAILDSCSSGALVRGKGGVSVPGFLLDGATTVEGHAFLTSSSADEISQEADNVGGSFFTHALLTGLRGGADSDLDGQVTLNEAYRFAYDETLARTEGTKYGPQHANYDIQLSGTGDLVMTDLRHRTARLELGSDVSGLLLVRDENGRLVAELRKTAGRPVQLGLEPGKYTITAQREDGSYRASTRVEGSGSVTLGWSAFSGMLLADARARGDEPAAEPAQQDEPAPPADMRPIHFGSITISRDPKPEDGPAGDHAALGFLVARSETLEGASVSLGISVVEQDSEGAQVALGASFSGGRLDGAQTSVGANITEGLEGVQAAAGFNLSTAHVEGAQLSAGANWAESLLGVQASPGVNVVLEGMEGGQGAAGANVIGGEAAGLQLAGGVNIVADRMEGFQAAGGANIAEELKGVQIAGGANISSGEADQGLKIGPVNVSGRMKGVTIGVVNVAKDMDGVPIGLLNIIEEGMFHGEIWGDSTGTVSIGLKTGSQHVYTLLAIGAAPGEDGRREQQSWMGTTGLALGGRFGPERVPIDMDLGVWTWQSGLFGQTGTVLVGPRLRAAAGLKLAKHFTPFVGVDLNLGVPVVTNDSRSPALQLPTPWEIQGEDDGLAFWPGVFGGLRF